MNLILVLFMLTTVALSTQADDEKVAEIKEFHNDNKGAGDYTFQFLTSNDIERSESGSVDAEGNYVVKGHYSYIASNGQKYYVTYTADKTGYHPVEAAQPPTPAVSKPSLYYKN